MNSFCYVEYRMFARYRHAVPRSRAAQQKKPGTAMQSRSEVRSAARRNPHTRAGPGLAQLLGILPLLRSRNGVSWRGHVHGRPGTGSRIVASRPPLPSISGVPAHSSLQPSLTRQA